MKEALLHFVAAPDLTLEEQNLIVDSINQIISDSSKIETPIKVMFEPLAKNWVSIFLRDESVYVCANTQLLDMNESSKQSIDMLYENYEVEQPARRIIRFEPKIIRPNDERDWFVYALGIAISVALGHDESHFTNGLTADKKTTNIRAAIVRMIINGTLPSETSQNIWQ